MKWGIRKYRNYDGTLTAAGKERYEKHPEKEEYERRKFNAAKSKYIHNPRNYKYLDDKEMSDAKNRLQTESQSRDMARPKKQTNSNSTGSKFASNIAESISRGIGNRIQKKIEDFGKNDVNDDVKEAMVAKAHLKATTMLGEKYAADLKNRSSLGETITDSEKERYRKQYSEEVSRMCAAIDDMSVSDLMDLNTKAFGGDKKK